MTNSTRWLSPILLKILAVGVKTAQLKSNVLLHIRDLNSHLIPYPLFYI
jgi:hypothetical protein